MKIPGNFNQKNLIENSEYKIEKQCENHKLNVKWKKQWKITVGEAALIQRLGLYQG